MTNPPTTTEPPEPKTAKPPQFSLLTLMLFVTVVGLYFGSARWIWILTENKSPPSGSIYSISFPALFIAMVYTLKVRGNWFSIICMLLGFCIPIVMSHIGEYYYSIDYESSLARRYVADGLWAYTYFWSIAAISSILHCKKQTGSVFPFVGKRPEE